jgi:TetR/AcrR family transcriptional regulator, regulator of cefoperazone and chloramphenicol sensitivity
LIFRLRYVINRLIKNRERLMTRGRPKRADGTRKAIIEAAMRGFAEKGFAATGTREIAAMANTNVASIAYHFGGKEGLRTACAEQIVELMGEVLEQARQGALPGDPATARMLLAALVRRMTGFLLLEPQARLVAGFMLREMAEPSEALDLIYEGLIETVHRRVCAIWGVATGQQPESAAVRLAVFTMIGQIIYFHVARPVVQRRMQWPSIGPAEADAVADAVTHTLLARIDVDQRMPA